MSEYNIQMNKYNALNVGYDQLYPATKIENVDGLDTALQNKVHGPITALKTHDEVDNAKSIGFYTFYGLDNGVYWNIFGQMGGTIFVMPLRMGYGQFFFPQNNDFVARRLWKESSTDWEPWEVFNPPMVLNTEYRTTERYQGKPVYAKLVDFGALPNSTTKDVDAGISSSEIYENRMIDLGKSTAYNPSDGRTSVFPIGAGIVNIYINNGAIRITTNTDRSGWSAKICVKYTKTTD